MGQFLIALACVYVALCGKGWASFQEETPLQTLTRAQVGTLYPAFSANIEDVIARLPTPPRDEDCRVLMVHPTLGMSPPREYQKRITLIEQLYKVDPLEETQPEDWTFHHGVSFFGNNTAYLAIDPMAAKALDLPMSVLESIVNTGFPPFSRRLVVDFSKEMPFILKDISFTQWPLLLDVDCTKHRRIVFRAFMEKTLKKELARFGNGRTPCTLCHETHPPSLLEKIYDPERARLVMPFLMYIETYRLSCQSPYYDEQRDFYVSGATKLLLTTPLSVLKTLGHEDFTPPERWRLLKGIDDLLRYQPPPHIGVPTPLLDSLSHEKLLRINRFCALATWGARDSLLPLSMPHLETIGTLLEGMKNPKKMTDMIRTAAKKKQPWLDVFAHLKTPLMKNKFPPEVRATYLAGFVERGFYTLDMQGFMHVLEEIQLRIGISWNWLMRVSPEDAMTFNVRAFHAAKNP